MTTEILLNRIKETEPTNLTELVKYFNCSYDCIETTLLGLMYTKNKYNNAIYNQAYGVIVSNKNHK